MAEAKLDTKAEVKKEGAPKKKILMFIIIGVVVMVLLVGGGLAAYLLLRSDPVADDAGGNSAHSAADTKASKKKEENKHPTVFEKLPVFTVNLNSEEGEVLQTEIALELPDAHVQESVKQVLPKIQGGINKLLSAKRPEEVKTPDGRNKLEVEVKGMVNKIIGAEGEDGVLSVNFTSFIVR
ncbi:MAG: flagellar basal body-associated FliL family protein [Formivibrio sp.]|nr:flagellar basal body-associated FliL family protein [Formivibrio sp.]